MARYLLSRSLAGMVAAACAFVALPAGVPAHASTGPREVYRGFVKHALRAHGLQGSSRQTTTSSPAATASDIFSSGGGVETAPAVYVDYWGAQWQNGFSTGGYSSFQAQNYINSFFGGVGASYWLNSTTQYCQGVTSGTFFCPNGATMVGNPKNQLKGVWTDGAANVPSTPTDSDINTELSRAVSHFGYDANGVYMILSPSGHSASGFGTQWCAWHGWNGSIAQAAFAYVPYMPDVGGSCGMNFINKSDDSFGHGYFDGFSVVGLHEYGEAVTDPLPIRSWADSSGSENADKCAWNRASGNTNFSTNYFAVQPLWSNQSGGCSMGFSTLGTSLSGYLASAPDASTWGTSRTDVFVRGTDNALWHRYWNGSSWSGWESLGGYLTSAPAAVSWSGGRIDVFARGGDGAAWHLAWDGNGWHRWESLGGQLIGGPDAASRGWNRLDLVAHGTDNALWHLWWDGARWNGWEPLGGYLTADPSAVSAQSGQLSVFVRGGDDALWSRSWNGSSWSSWGSLGGYLSSGPDAASWGSGHLEVFIRGGDYGLYRLGYDPASNWSGWQRLGGTWSSDPSAVEPAVGSTQVYVRGPDNGLWLLNLNN